MAYKFFGHTLHSVRLCSRNVNLGETRCSATPAVAADSAVAGLGRERSDQSRALCSGSYYFASSCPTRSARLGKPSELLILRNDSNLQYPIR